ncbi:protein phosphatase 1 regulatory subunit 3C-like [Montipora foliosa]|uniref:protein phosphatase 1 regulatory subunit 3C-like n=1 Tax=Montipora foliosa TaxID=591990 RepID=UPI0035F20363
MRADAQQTSSMQASPTPGSKKVCFADLVGLKLEFVKTITPCSSEDNLTGLAGVVNRLQRNHCDINGNILLRQRTKRLLPCFVNPSKTDGFMRRVFDQNVCLENIACENFVVTGLIRVTNLSYTKEVTIRFTFDNWDSYRDSWADYMSSLSDGKTDKFTFRITVPCDFEVHRFMSFAIRYRVMNQEFWDNNDTKNYHVQCLDV